MSLPERSPLRLKGYDYSGAGYYFVTVCVQNRRNLLRRGAQSAPKPEDPALYKGYEAMRRGAQCAPAPEAPVLYKGYEAMRRGAQCAPAPAFPPLSEIGETVEQTILEIPAHYPSVEVDRYVIMPNHIHMILILKADDGGRTLCAPTPTLSQIVRMMKETVTKRLKQKIWQKGFYDHIIRNESDYLRIWQYIDDNPAKWEEDEYYAQ